jgi:small subunit ribosomal protein S20
MAEEKKKTKRPTAEKRDIRNSKRRDINRTFKSQVLTAKRELEKQIGNGDQKGAMESLNTFYSLMDKGVKRGVYKPNKANRSKARFAAAIQRVQS